MEKITSPLLIKLLETERTLKKTLSDLATDIHIERLSLIFGTHKIRVGSIVEYRGKTYLVRRLSHLDWEMPWAYGSPQKKDGTFSKSEHYLFSEWKVITP